MSRQKTMAVLFLLLCGLLSVLAVAGKVQQLKQQDAFERAVIYRIWDLEASQNATDVFAAQQYMDLRELNTRVSLLEIAPVPQFEVRGDAYCFMAQDNGSVVLSCRPFD